jgi:ribosomal protein L37AE/L43A
MIKIMGRPTYQKCPRCGSYHIRILIEVGYWFCENCKYLLWEVYDGPSEEQGTTEPAPYRSQKPWWKNDDD